MATFADLVRKRRESGSGRIGALAASTGKKFLEKIDPRQVFGQSGLLTALFPSLKTYKASAKITTTRPDIATQLSASTTPLLEQMIVKLGDLEITSKLVAKNTMALPAMSRDMNVMRQNVIKLVKLQGGKAATRADAFFLRAFEREKATESELQAAKERRATGKTTPVTALKEKASSLPLLGLIVSPLLTAITSLKNLLEPILKSGLKLVFDLAGSVAKLAVTGGAEILKFTGKNLAKLLIKVAPLLLNPAVLATLGVGGIGWLLMKLIEADRGEKIPTEEISKPEGLPGGYTPEQATTSQSQVPAATTQELAKARESMAIENPEAAAYLERTSPLPMTSTGQPTTPVPVPLSGFEKMAVDMIKKHEGLPKNGKAYKDAHGHSIGYGHFITPREIEQGFIQAGDERIPVNQSNILETKITPEQAEKLLAHDLPKYIRAAQVPLGEAWDKLNDAQKAALVSSAYNTGQGGIQHLVNKGLKTAIMSGDFKSAAKIIAEHGYKTAVIGGQRQTVGALVRRRAEEAEIISSTAGAQLSSASSAMEDSRLRMSTQPSSININAPSMTSAAKTPAAMSSVTADVYNTDFNELLLRSV